MGQLNPTNAIVVVQQGSKWNKCEIHSRDGIIDVAENEHVDLIVMGSRRGKERKGICCLAN